MGSRKDRRALRKQYKRMMIASNKKDKLCFSINLLNFNNLRGRDIVSIKIIDKEHMFRNYNVNNIKNIIIGVYKSGARYEIVLNWWEGKYEDIIMDVYNKVKNYPIMAGACLGIIMGMKADNDEQEAG